MRVLLENSVEYGRVRNSGPSKPGCLGDQNLHDIVRSTVYGLFIVLLV